MINTNKATHAAHETISRAIHGLKSLDESINNQFSDIVDLIHHLKGRVIISGMGKSGHIARKIAATFASTGTPSYFVHPGEASHGDLGMITCDDAVLLLSNSGETKELSDMINYCKRFDIPMIGLARRPGSTLINDATIGIALPDTPEQSLTGAPTTSTTMMLVYGDAIAMALLAQRGFSPADFGIFHPGGKLGANLVRVAKLMHGQKTLPLVNDKALMKEALFEMTSKTFGCIGITDQAQQLVGMITDGDIRRHIDHRDFLQLSVNDVMTKNPLTITENILASEAMHIMNNKQCTALFVINEQQKPIGIIHLHDCLRAGL